MSVRAEASSALEPVGTEHDPESGQVDGRETGRNLPAIWALASGAACGLSLLFLVLLGAAIRMAPHSPFYVIPGGYRAFSVYDIRHILITTHEIRQSARLTVTSYSSGVFLGTQDILRHKVDASIMLLMGLGPTNLSQYYQYGLWSPLVTFPLAVLAVYSALARAARTQRRAMDVFALVAFSIAGSFNMLEVTPHGETNTATGWTFLLVALYGLIRIPENPVLGRLLFFVFSALVVLIYHTTAILLACTALALAGSALLARIRARASTLVEKTVSHSASTVLVTFVLVVAYFMYVSVSFLGLFAKTLAHAPSLADYLLRQQSGRAPRDFLLRGFLSHGDAQFTHLEAVLAVLVTIPVAVVVVMGLTCRLARAASDTSQRVIFPWILGLIPFVAALFLWSGVTGVLLKAGEFGSIWALVALASLLASRIKGIRRSGFYALVGLCVTLSCLLYYRYEEQGASYLTYPEEQAATWLTKHASPNDAVFTDLRLAAPLIEANHLAVVGINDYDPPQLVRRELLAVYYGSNAVDVWPALRKVNIPPRAHLRFAMFSKRAEHDLPGIKGYDYNFRAAPADYMKKFLRVPAFSLVYDNGTIRIFEIRGTGAAGK
ncbi:MAG: hypothetical protein ACR2JC_18480 [Chloroflexota bacterium]